MAILVSLGTGLRDRSLLFVLAFLLLILAISITPIVSCDQETYVNVRFNVLTGSDTQDYFTGDYFWYNITMTYGGTITLNTTFTVTVRNTTGGIFGAVVSYKEYLSPNDTVTLYPNYTRLEKNEVYIYPMDTVGTYTIELTCDTSMSFYRYYETGRYIVDYNRCHMTIDAMPSYQKAQDDRWNQYLQENQNIMTKIQDYIAQSRVESDRTRYIAVWSVFVAVVSIFVNIFSIPDTRRRRIKWTLTGFGVISFVILLLVLYFM